VYTHWLDAKQTSLAVASDEEWHLGMASCSRFTPAILARDARTSNSTNTRVRAVSCGRTNPPACDHRSRTPFFERRAGVTTRAFGSPNTPRTVGSGWKPGKAYASQNRRFRFDELAKSVVHRRTVSCTILPWSTASNVPAQDKRNDYIVWNPHSQ